MSFNWFLDNWWVTYKPSCIADGSVKPEDLDMLIRTSLILEHFPNIEDERVDEPNVGNIVSNYCIHKQALKYVVVIKSESSLHKLFSVLFMHIYIYIITTSA